MISVIVMMGCDCTARLRSFAVYYDAGMTISAERISRLEGSYEQVDKRLGDLTASVNRVSGDLNSLRADMNAKFNTLIVVFATGWVAVAGAIVVLALRS